MTNVRTFVKKPVQIEAIQFFDTVDRIHEICEWSKEGIVVDYTDPSSVTLRIHTLEGTMTANEGDWIIKGIQGEFYPCKPDIFETTYEELK